MSQTLRRTISPNTVLLFELGWDILLYESLKMICFSGNHWFLLFFFLIHEKIRKFTFSRFFRNDHFFRLRCETFVRIFNLDKLYRHTTPSAWPIFRDFSFPEMASIEIWTDKTFSNFNFKSLALPICCRPSGRRFSRTPYYSSSRDETSCSTSHCYQNSFKWFDLLIICYKFW